MGSSFALACFAVIPAAQQGAPSAPPGNGYWEPAFQHDPSGFVPEPARFNAVHMALIPKGPHQGHVLVWDVEGPQAPPAWDQRWAILDVADPLAPVFWNDELTLPSGRGDFFCAGHAWTSNGELLVAGGTTRYPVVGEGTLGGKLVYLWDPDGGPSGAWRRQQDLSVTRWYPTVVLIATGELLIAGGTPGGGLPARNDYEVFAPRVGAHGWTRLAPTGLFPGPRPPAGELGLYPRLHQLETGEQFLAGESGAAAKMDHAGAPGRWTYTAPAAAFRREHVNSVLAPRRAGAAESVWTIGGEAYDALGNSQGVLGAVETCVPGASGSPGWDWAPLRRLREARSSANAVILPDGRVLLIGGVASPDAVYPEIPVDVPELLDGNHRWPMMPGASPRSYHSTAVLLPSGKVLTGGGNTSTYDYQVFVPPYVLDPGRPRILSAPASLPFASVDPTPRTALFAPLPSGETVARVVLIAPGSVTHHFDASQRYVELALVSSTATSVSFLGPSHAAQAPRGYYMLFLVSSRTIPSVARWVYVG